MRLRNMFKICLDFWKSESQYAYKRHALKKYVSRRRVSDVKYLLFGKQSLFMESQHFRPLKRFQNL